ncbi:hypothetical protein GCM10007049_04830 [Echinicola pacifica]|uniref:Uncharacterized protein n=1 Tax=Echinicola pacifica TaxID=346377 RepID=A0A918PN19_9BACT|nr:hypothetical protein GCM10007049_04830 [Echinicola pacifica]
MTSEEFSVVDFWVFEEHAPNKHALLNSKKEAPFRDIFLAFIGIKDLGGDRKKN